MARSGARITGLTELGSEPPRFSAKAGALTEALVAHLCELGQAESAAPESLKSALRYSLERPGKCARGLLTLLVCDSISGEWQPALECAAAVELVHAASLIIDDLPAMDDADLRRGRPSSHRAHGEATSILTAFALLNDAFGRLAGSAGLSARQRVGAVAALAAVVGPDGMIGGQQRDLHPEASTPDYVACTHAMKTGALFAGAAQLGAIAAGLDQPRERVSYEAGMLLGEAFQGFDDLLDIHGQNSQLGKDVGKDEGKPTFVSLLGSKAAEQRALDQIAGAMGRFERIGADMQELEAYVVTLTRMMRYRMGHDRNQR